MRPVRAKAGRPMPLKDDWKLGEADGKTAAAIVLEEIARRRMSRRHLADLSRISLSTLEKVLSGRRPFTLPTMVRIEEVLGVSLRPSPAIRPSRNGSGNGNVSASELAGAGGIAPDEVGSYARATVAWLEGSYLTVRPSFGSPAAIYAYRTDIAWDEARSLLAFREAERIDSPFTQFGVVAVPHQSGHVYLVTNRHGQHRLVVVSKPTITGEMHGLLTTLKVGRGAQLTPISTPIVLAPMKAASEAAFGQIAPGHKAYSAYKALLARTLADEYALIERG